MLWIGTSGWQYRHWDASFYPREVPKAGQLRYYAERFRVVEVNATFYRLPGPGVLGAWAEQTPDDFVFVVKASRFLTHFKKLKDPEEPVERLMSRASELGPKLGPVLLQLPPNMHRNEERLDAALALLAPQARVAVEFRHDSWYAEGVREVLARHGAALCLADRGGQPITPIAPEWRTAEWGYLRFHGGGGAPPGCYHEETLDRWAAVAKDLWGAKADVYVFFNNDWYRCALRDAGWFARLAKARGLRPTRVAPPETIDVG
ncbi:MAG TPA: DUF72 domain-containing protein [Thermoanaerobaculia bacterium]|nr:DUF72 domain-containing protein [Thermoanaerobaculia bacterium]